MIIAGQRIHASDIPSATTYAEYQATADQTVTTTTDTECAYATTIAQTTMVKIFAVGAGHGFTFNKAGLWAVTVNERWAPVASGERAFYLMINGGQFQNSAQPGSSAASSSFAFGIIKPFAIGDSVWVVAYQNSGGNLARQANVAGSGRICFAWLGG